MSDARDRISKSLRVLDADQYPFYDDAADYSDEQAEYDRMSEEATPDAVQHSIRCDHCNTIQMIVRIIPANMRHADPTESYVLQCGHTVI